MSRPFQFSLRGLLTVVTVLGVWLGWHTEREHRSTEAIRAIQKIGADVSGDEPRAVCLYSGHDILDWRPKPGEKGVNFKPLLDAEIEAVIPHLQVLLPNVVYLRDVASKFGSATFSRAIKKRLTTALPKCTIIHIEPFSAWVFPHSRHKKPHP